MPRPRGACAALLGAGRARLAHHVDKKPKLPANGGACPGSGRALEVPLYLESESGLPRRLIVKGIEKASPTERQIMCVSATPMIQPPG